MGQKRIVRFEACRKKDIGTVGGKGANLGEMTHADIPVPPGFVVTVDAYNEFLRSSGVADRISDLLGTLDHTDFDQVQAVSAHIEKLITHGPVFPELAREIEDAYGKMEKGPVAVRSSATAEDLAEASFAGQQSTFLNVEGEKQVVDAVYSCWASLFNPRAICYRRQQGLDHMQVGIAVPIQRMVQAETAGIMFTVHPVTNDSGQIAIEAIYGLGELVVSGQVNPDIYFVTKQGLSICDKTIRSQEWMLIKNPGHGAPNKRELVSIFLRSAQKLPDKDIIRLAALGKQIEDWYQFPQDIEWAKEGEQIFVVQSRPITTIRSQEGGGGQ
jgi:pyruvate,water dikinase